MNQNRKTTIILVGFVLVGLIVCGIIGYINDSGRVSSNTVETANTVTTDTPTVIDLGYCSRPTSLCIISFGRDNAENMLIIIRNNVPGLAEFYTKIKQSTTVDLYKCQKIQSASDIYYCWGSQIPEGTMVTMEVYSKNDDRLVASGSLPVSIEATPLPIATIVPIITKVPTATTFLSPTQTLPAYPSSSGYPYP